MRQFKLEVVVRVPRELEELLGLLRRRWAEAAIFVGLDPTDACVRAWREIDDLGDWPAFKP